MLHYEASLSKTLELKHHKWDKSITGKTQLYEVPMPEFSLLNLKLREDGEEEIVNKGIAGPCIFIVIGGEVCLGSTDGNDAEECLKTGQVVFVKPNVGFRMKAIGGGAEVWGAFVEV